MGKRRHFDMERCLYFDMGRWREKNHPTYVGGTLGKECNLQFTIYNEFEEPKGS